MTAQPLLVGKNLHRSFRIGKNEVKVLRGIDFSVSAGEAVFLFGSSGAGKTTLLYTLAGLERPESGTVEFEGKSLYALSGSKQAELRNRRMGFVFQSYFLLPELTALENVMLPCLIAGKPGNERAEALLKRVGLGERMHHLPAELSGGEQQRVAIARSLVNDPIFLFADEPTGNLDSKTGGEIMELLLGIVREEKRSLLVVTHDQRLAALGDRIARIEDGKMATA
jgi:predicted ABC-type transport system involved in lysophospholipase L1 biosynthesis ATPase subunit